jgi:hypothetical protein
LPLTKKCLIGELKEHETTNNFSGFAAGIGGSVFVNYLCPVEAGGGGMSDFWKDYEPEPSKTAPVQEPVAIPEYIRDAAKHLHENRFEPSFMVRAIVGWINGSPPAAQPAPALEGRDWSLLEATQESLREHMAEIKRLKAAQPAVPDAIGPNEDELPAYVAGWNDCRQAMLEMMK